MESLGAAVQYAFRFPGRPRLIFLDTEGATVVTRLVPDTDMTVVIAELCDINSTFSGMLLLMVG
jgi:hypothetical protein